MCGKRAEKHYITFPKAGGRIISDGRMASSGRKLRRSAAMESSIASDVSFAFRVPSCKEKFVQIVALNK
jgi:hypothetical protein